LVTRESVSPTDKEAGFPNEARGPFELKTRKRFRPAGGLGGLIQTFHQKGLGDVVNSWVGTGQNQPISPDQVHSALGSDTVQQLASNAGVSTETATSSLSQMLPMFMDKLTPNGQIPQQGNLMQSGMDMLKSWGKTGTEG